MHPKDLLKTVYFGDRWCTKIVIDNMKVQFELHINQIGRVRDFSEKWNYYNDENINNGIIVIERIESVCFDEADKWPNDAIYDISVNDQGEGKYEYIIDAAYVNGLAEQTNVKIKIIGGLIFLIDPQYPDKRIID
jgi:hypothetical protein